MINVKFTFDRLSNPSMKERVMSDAPDFYKDFTQGQILEIYFEKDGFAADFEITDRSVTYLNDGVNPWYEYKLKYIPRTTHSV